MLDISKLHSLAGKHVAVSSEYDFSSQQYADASLVVCLDPALRQMSTGFIGKLYNCIESALTKKNAFIWQKKMKYDIIYPGLQDLISDKMLFEVAGSNPSMKMGSKLVVL